MDSTNDELTVTYVSLDTKDKTNLKDDPFHCSVNMPSPIVGNIRSISLCSLELPLNFNQIRSPYNTFSFVLGDTFISLPTQRSTTFTVTIPEGNYNITTLISTINSLLANLITTDTSASIPVKNGVANYNLGQVVTSMSISISSTTMNIITLNATINSTNFNNMQMNIFTNPTGKWLGYLTIWCVPMNFSLDNYIKNVAYFDASTILGISNYKWTSSTTSTKSTVSLTDTMGNIYYDTYISMVFENLTSKTLGTTASFFRVPINVATGSVYYWSENTSFVQKIQTDIKSLNYVKIKILDRYGNSMNNNNVDFSFLIKVETEE